MAGDGAPVVVLVFGARAWAIWSKSIAKAALIKRTRNRQWKTNLPKLICVPEEEKSGGNMATATQRLKSIFSGTGWHRRGRGIVRFYKERAGFAAGAAARQAGEDCSASATGSKPRLRRGTAAFCGTRLALSFCSGFDAKVGEA